jgi:NAD(P)H-hydrate repair Nnr-like enzyme with NAD(P)H-hydrate dehydratase domain
VPLLLDADALFLLTLEPYQQLLTNASPVVLTPNAIERKRLQGLEGHWKDHAVVIEKGEFDVIQYTTTTSSRSSRSSSSSTQEESSSITCNEVGGLKRSGGLGDILPGTLGTLVAWNGILTKQGVASADDLPLACWTACSFVKSSTHQAFLQHRRAMTAPDVLAELGPTIDQMTTPPTRTNMDSSSNSKQL